MSDRKVKRTMSSLDSPTAFYPRDRMAEAFDDDDDDDDSVDSVPELPEIDLVPYTTPQPAPKASGTGGSISWFYMALSLAGGALMAIGVVGLLVVAYWLSS